LSQPLYPASILHPEAPRPRRHPRIAVDVPALSWAERRAQSVPVKGRLTVLGAGGARLDTDETYSEDGVLSLSFTLPPPANGITCRAIVLVAILVGLANVAFAPLASRLAHFAPASRGALAALFLLGSPVVLLSFWNASLSALLNVQGRFAVPAALAAVRSAAVLAAIAALGDALGVYAIMLGYALGELLLLAALMLAAGPTRPPVRWEPRLLPDSALFLKAGSFGLINAAILSSNPLVDRAMASWIGVGSVTLLQYSATPFFILFGTVAVGFETAISSRWSRAYHSDRGAGGFPREVRRVARLALAASLPMALLAYLLRGEIVLLLFRWGRFPASAVAEMSAMTGLYALALVPAMLAIVFSQFFLVRKRPDVLTAVAGLNVALNASLNWLCIGAFGLRGVALSTVVTSSLCAAALFLLFRRFAAEGR
ncbi:MAG: polysaccharide biosynthesis C-terminal domain-containing protein, partial [Elusimicrobia bacterium]|nr:polysaccharide biosynthesis C-terminal domain-containing protein [Elusimicrobiota bacterium]